MPIKKSVGNMYTWVTHTHCHLGGECPHKCTYCYVDNPRWGRPDKYTGKIRLLEHEFKVNYGTDKTIFIECMNDLFANEVPRDFILKVLDHCKEWPECKYVFQTKNPKRYYNYLAEIPVGSILGCTIETNREIFDISKAPAPKERAFSMAELPFKKFITIEPILDFDIVELSQWMNEIRPDFLNIGADSKGHGMKEPRFNKILSFVKVLNAYGIQVNKKSNLHRLENKP